VWYLLPVVSILVPLIAIASFALIWLFVIWLISILSGWQRYAQTYRALQPADGKRWPSQYGLVNGSRYGNALNLTTNDEGLFLEAVPFFNFNHPRLFIPWHDFHDATPITYRWRELLRVQVGTPAMGTMSLPPAVFAETAGRIVLEESFIETNVLPTSSTNE
jgi:hypothetical protein